MPTIRAFDQLSIVDMTDGYTVSLTADSFSVVGTNAGNPISSQTLVTTAQVYRGTNQLTSGVTITAASITTPTGVSVASVSGLQVTLTVSTSFSGRGIVTIPIVIGSGNDAITFTKTVSISVSPTGPTGATGATGATGPSGADGADAIKVEIEPDSSGIIFKNSTGTKTLTAHVYVGLVEKTISNNGTVADSLGTIYWYKGGTKVTTPSKTLTIQPSDVDNVLAISCKLEQGDN